MPKLVDSDLGDSDEWQSGGGYCMHSYKTIAIWVAQTRTVWERKVTNGALTIECTANAVIYSLAPPAGATIADPIETFKWPVATSPSGWRKVGTLKPGHTLAVPAL